MTAIFADTFYWVALTDPDDTLYAQAAELESRFAGTLIVTTDEILTEFLTFFSRGLRLRRRAVDTVRRADPRSEYSHLSPEPGIFSGRV